MKAIKIEYWQFFLLRMANFLLILLKCVFSEKHLQVSTKDVFSVNVFTLQKVLSLIHILANKLHGKTATLGKASHLIGSIITVFESL